MPVTNVDFRSNLSIKATFPFSCSSTMHLTTILPLVALLSSATAVQTIFNGCTYSKLQVEPWYNCNELNGGTDPCQEQQSCYMACGRAGSNDKPKDFVMVAEQNGPGAGNTCSCKCYLK